MFLTSIFLLIVFLFKNAFSINFFADDYFFLKAGRVDSIQEIANFFIPNKDYFYRPIASELFYFIIHLFKENIFLSHLLVFGFYFLGLYFLYKSILKITGNKILTYSTVFLYGINFIHVFQLYYFGSFQEVALFSFLSISFWFYLNEKAVASSIFFVLALLSKETAILYSLFLPVFSFAFLRKNIQKHRNSLIALIIIAVAFAGLYKYSLSFVTQLDNYRINLNPRLFANNLMWYFLWSLGLPNYMPDYMTSVFKPPIKEFWKVFRNYPETKIFFALLFTYLSTVIMFLVAYLFKEKKKILDVVKLAAFSLFGFVAFIGPIGFLSHKWMIRLTLPLIFVSLFQGYALSLFYKKGGLFRKASYVLIALYFLLNIYGIKIHESSSTFFLESRISDHLKTLMRDDGDKIKTKDYVYFKDVKIKDFNPWGQSKHLKTTLSDQNFLDLYLPKNKIKAIYGFEEKNIPDNSFVINSLDLLRP